MSAEMTNQKARLGSGSQNAKVKERCTGCAWKQYSLSSLVKALGLGMLRKLPCICLLRNHFLGLLNTGVLRVFCGPRVQGLLLGAVVRQRMRMG